MLEKQYLDKILKTGNVPHLMLFLGPKESVLPEALDFARKWLQKITDFELPDALHDLHLVKVEGKLGMHSMQSIREMLEKAALAPFQARGKVFVIEDAERMLPYSANALLKTIEEPKDRTLFILLTSDPEKLLPTIRSRCQTVRFKSEAKEKSLYYDKLKELFYDRKPSLLEIMKLCDEIHKAFDAKRKTLEQENTSVSKDALKEMTAEQRHKVEHELEGAISSKWHEEVSDLLLGIAHFYRDAHKKNPESIPLEKVQEALKFTKLAIERSTPLKNALESLFLRLQP